MYRMLPLYVSAAFALMAPSSALCTDEYFHAKDYKTGSSSGGIQEAIDAASTAGGGTVMIPHGSTNVPCPGVTVSANVSLEGYGRGVSIIQSDHAGEGCAAVTVSGNQAALRKLTVNVLNPKNTTIGVDFIDGNNGLNEFTWDQVVVTGDSSIKQGTGVRLQGLLKSQFIGGEIKYWNKAFHVLPAPDGPPLSNANLLSGVKLRASQTAVHIDRIPSYPGCRDLWMSSVTIEGNDVIGIDIEGRCQVALVASHLEKNPINVRVQLGSLISFGNRYLQANANRDIYLTGSSPFIDSSISLGDQLQAGVENASDHGALCVNHNDPVFLQNSSIGAVECGPEHPIRIGGGFLFWDSNAQCVYEDSDGDGVRSSGEPCLSGRTNSPYHGVALWGIADAQGTLDSGDEVCAEEGLTCTDAIDLSNPGSPADSTCTSTYPADTKFLAMCN